MIKSLVKGLFFFSNRIQLTDRLLLLPFEKRERLANIARASGAQTFIETGTFHGETTKFIAPLVKAVYSFEIDPDAAALARKECEAFRHVQIINEPSETGMRTVLKEISGPTLFWLDAHYQTGMKRGKLDCPLFAELQAIFDAKQIEPVVMIDDARKFLGVNNWPSLAMVERFVAKRAPDFSFRVSHDMIAIGRFSM